MREERRDQPFDFLDATILDVITFTAVYGTNSLVIHSLRLRRRGEQAQTASPLRSVCSAGRPEPSGPPLPSGERLS